MPSAAVRVCEAPHKATGASGRAGARAGRPTTEINTPCFRWGGADKPHANRMWCLTQLEKAEESRRRLPLRTGLDGAEEEPVILFFFLFSGSRLMGWTAERPVPLLPYFRSVKSASESEHSRAATGNETSLSTTAFESHRVPAWSRDFTFTRLAALRTLGSRQIAYHVVFRLFAEF